MKFSKSRKCILTAVLAVTMAFPGYAMADGPSAKEELEEILEVLAEGQENTLLTKELAFERLLESIEDNGLQLVMDMGMTENTVATLGLEGEVPEDGRVVVTTVIDPKLKKWMFDTTLHAEGEEFVDFSIYADKDLLSVVASELYSGAVAIRSGSFKAQFEGSALQQLMEIEGEIPDFNLKFYPEEDDFAAFPVEYYQENLEEQAEMLEESMRVEKAEADGQTVYTAYIQTEAIMEMYGSVMDLYMDVFLETGLISAYEVEEFNTEYDSMLGQMELLMGEELAVDYYVQNGQIQKCTFEMVIDPSVIEPDTEYVEIAENPAQDLAETPVTEMVEGTLEEAGIVELEADMEVADEGGIIHYDILFADPANPYQNFDVNMTVMDMSGNEIMGMTVTKATQATEISERTEISMAVSEYGEVLYSGTPMWMEYNSQTGDLDAAFEVNDGIDEVALRLDSTITKETGRFISWQIDELAVEVDGESIGVQGCVLVSSEPETIAPPENPKMIMELDEGELMGVLTEIMYNLEELTAEPETEYVEYGYSEVTTANAV